MARSALKTPTAVATAATALAAVAVVHGTQVGPRPPLTTPPPTPLWRVEGQARGGAAADESTAYVVSKGHEVIAIDATTGKVRWRVPSGEYGDYHYGETAVPAGSVVVVGDYNIVAFDRTTGRERWRFVPSEGYGPGIYMGAATEGLVLAGSPSGRVYAVEGETGRLRWQAVVSDKGNTTAFPPVRSGRVVAAGFTEFSLPGTGGVVAMAADTGRMLWKQYFPRPGDPTLSTNFAGGLVVYGELVIAASGDGLIYAFDITSGEIEWSIPRLAPNPLSVASPDRDFRPLTITNGILVSGSLTGTIVGYDVERREEKWRFHDRWVGSTAFRNTAAEGVAYIPYLSGMVIALDASTGTELWRMGDWSAGLIWPPAFSGNRIIISGSGYGYVAVPRVLPN